MDKRLASGIAVVITAVWAVSNVVSWFTPEYEPSASVHATMMAVAGALFGTALLNGRNGKHENGK